MSSKPTDLAIYAKASSIARNLPNMIWITFDGWDDSVLVCVIKRNKTVSLSQNKSIYCLA